VDVLEFFMMTPLPGSADHRDMYLAGRWLEPDLNRYDTEHPAAEHPRMSAEEWKAAYDRAWHLYYSPEHVATLLRRARVGGARPKRLAGAVLTFYGSYRFEGVHPLQAGAFRRKVRRTRRPGIPAEHPLLFYPRRAWQILTTYASGALYYLWLHRLRRRIERDPAGEEYSDAAIAGVVVGSVGSRKVMELPDFAETTAGEPGGFPAFKQARGRRNQELLEALERKAVEGARASRTDRRPLALALPADADEAAKPHAKCDG